MGKPLISDAQLRAIHEAMLRLREMQQTGPRSQQWQSEGQPIAMLAATLLQLHTGDVVVADGPHPLAVETLALSSEKTFHPANQPDFFQMDFGAGAAIFAAGYAMAQSRSSQPGDRAPITVVLTQQDAPVEQAMRLAGEHYLPLLIILNEAQHTAHCRLESPANVEVVNIDASDAIACCRVMQESLLRVRNRWGAVVLRGISLPDSADPVTALEAHMRRRAIDPTIAVRKTAAG